MNCENDIKLCGLNEETQEIECSKIQENIEDMSNITMSKFNGTVLVFPDTGINCCWLVFDKPHYDKTGKRRTITKQDLSNGYLNVTFNILSMKKVTHDDHRMCHNMLSEQNGLNRLIS